jgi:uracil-DNA glycosylase
MYTFNFKAVHPSFINCIEIGLSKINPLYLEQLSLTNDWLPGKEKIFNAFSLPLQQVNYVLFGESPYPRLESANGYAFWDQAVSALWSDTGLSKEVNRATSLRNIVKMLLLAEGLLQAEDTGQAAIAQIDKSHLVQSSSALFNRLIQKGFLLLNATPVLQSQSPQKDAAAWLPFIQEILRELLEQRPNLTLILFGQIANTIEKLVSLPQDAKKLYAEHPYNLSFITNLQVIEFFRPLHLLRKN